MVAGERGIVGGATAQPCPDAILLALVRELGRVDYSLAWYGTARGGTSGSIDRTRLFVKFGQGNSIPRMVVDYAGQAQEGLTLLTQGLTAVRATGCVIGTPHVLMMIAEAHAMLGQPVEGLNCLAEAAQIIETTEERVNEAELYRLRGDLLNATGDPPTAESNYYQALAVARRQSAKLFELRASVSLARLWYKQGKRAEAGDLLAPIYGWFTEGFDTPALEEAKTLLEELA